MTHELTPGIVSFDELGFFSRLYRQYCADFDRLAPFYNVDFRTRDGRVRSANAAATHPRDRQKLVEALREQNARWGEDESVSRNIDALLDSGSVAVVTGQQVGLFTGPVYTIYKTLTVLQMARRLAEESGRTVVPVFWLEGDDHDFDEIASATLLTGNEVTVLRYTGHAAPPEGNLGPVGRLPFTEQIAEVVNELDATLPPTEFKPALMDAVRAAYRPGVTILDAFARLMRSFFKGQGLVFISPDDRRLKELVAPLFAREIRDTHRVSGDLDGVSERLRAEYHAQVAVRPSNLFLIDERGRHPLDADDGVFRLRGADERFSGEDLIASLNQHPERFSANVVLRPLVQDSLLPTAIYVAGPSEIAYFAQFKPVYEWAGVPMPAIYPRASVTLVEGKVRKVLDEYGLNVGDMDDELESLFQRVVRERLGSDVDAQFDQSVARIDEAIDALKPLLKGVDPTLVKSADATRAVIQKEFERFRHRVLKAEKRNHEQVRVKLEKARANLFPGGKPQERSISVLYFLNKYGPGLLADLERSLNPESMGHQVLFL
ncbi:MAG TPA: bacillithiol biosynthesis cysteine-adding enzyme BshC [Rhodothermales bacterium]